MTDIHLKSGLDFCGCPGTGPARMFRTTSGSGKGYRYGTTKRHLKPGEVIKAKEDMCCCGPIRETPEAARAAFIRLLEDSKDFR